MIRCTEYDPLIESLLASEIGDADRDRLLRHAEGCAGCREFIDLHYRLQDPELAGELPTPGEFAAARRAVLARIESQGTGFRLPTADGVIDLLGALLRRPTFALGAAAATLALVAAGYVAGQRGATLLPPDTLTLDSLIAQIGREAEGNVRLADVEDSPFVFSNVAFEDAQNGRLAMRFDVTRHVEVQRAKDDPLVQEVLAQTLVNPTPLGTRLAALGHVGAVMDPKIEEALIFSMLNDPTVAVRIKALQLLAAHEPSEEIRSAFMMVLSGEESVQMRLVAMDYLVASGASQERLDQVLDDLQRDADWPLRMRAASVGEGDSR